MRAKQILTVCLMLGSVLPARAETGVSDERVSLPDGPGSIGGVGDNAQVSPNMGAMSYRVPLEVPAGFAGVTPELALTYSSMMGSSEVGIGWDLPIAHIERYTLRGVPTYTSADVFAADGSEELVEVASSGTKHTYRARFEGGFVRYTWHADATGAAGYFQAEYPNGTQAFFGADSQGKPVADARVSHPDGGVFRYLIVEQIDRFGHRVRYDYKRYGNHPLIDQISYVFTDGAPRYRVAFSYERRKDAIANGLPGFELVLAQRLSSVTVFSRDVAMRRYELNYEEAAAGISRLAAVTQFGLNDEPFPVHHTFGYSASLEIGCSDCTKPLVVDMGTLAAGGAGAVDMQNGRSTLIDINGDSLPDILDTGAEGVHRFFLNTMDSQGVQRFSAPAASARTPGSSAFTLRAPGVQAADVNGDGFTDLVHTVRNEVLCNDGSGDWSPRGDCAADVRIDGLTADEDGDADPSHVRFMDYDGDRRIDLIMTPSADATSVFHNTKNGFVQRSVEAIGAVFDESNLQLADMNGDGLLDPAEVLSSGVVRYRINLGRGTWSHWQEAPLTGFGGNSAALEEAELQDLNGDGLDDVVIVLGDSVSFALNRAGQFLPFESLTSGDVEGDLPTRDASTTVLFADMNGSGSSDVVWISSCGHVQFLELFVLRPNLLTRIDNGIGGVQLVEYGTSARELARDLEAGEPWRYRLPQAMNLVTATDSYATFTPAVTSRTELRYHHGFYDGLEKRYRGFEVVEREELSEAARDSQEAGLAVMDYDVGATDPYHNGLLVREQVYGGEGESRYRIQRILNSYEDCPLADLRAEGLRLPVRHTCRTATETLLQEGRPESEWVTVRSEQSYDGYGNVISSKNLGVVGMGPSGTSACLPCSAPEGTFSGACGSACTGDEAYTESAYIAPGEATGGAWIVGSVARTISYGVEGGRYQESLSYYDGEPFVGLPRGQLTKGLVSRVCVRVDPNASDDCRGPGWVAVARAKYDAHGNAVETLDPLGAKDDVSGHRRLVEYEADGLKARAVELFLANDAGPYRLRREVEYDPVFAEPVTVTRWTLVGAEVRSDPAPTHIAYDAFGRRSAIAQPGDSLDQPSSTFTYELADPVSQVVTRVRSVPGQPMDLEQRTCVDGFGRTVQTRTKLADDLWQVTDFHEVNRRGATIRAYQPYQSELSACEATAPADVAFASIRYDAVQRLVQSVQPDAGLYGEPSVSSIEYAPLRMIERDAEDNDPESPAYDTPQITRTDGLGRTVSLERYLGKLGEGGEVGRITTLFDDLGHMAGYVDPLGHRKAQESDLLGRVVHIEDPNAGSLDFTYDAAGNILAQTDARGDILAMRYDGQNRQIAQFDANDEAATMVRMEYDYVEGCKECSHAEGQLVRVRYPLGGEPGQGKDEAGFDARGREVWKARTLEGHRFVIRHDYDNASRRTATTYPDGTRLVHSYDGASRLGSIEGVLDEVKYDERGLLASVAHANGVRFEQQHDALLRVRTQLTRGPNGSEVLQGFAYERDRVGTLIRVDDMSERTDGMGWRQAFEHDAWYRVRKASYGEGEEQLEFAFDLVDNVVRKASSLGARSRAHVGELAYDGPRPNAVMQAGEVSYLYDDAGRVERRGDTELVWDYQGRLREAQGPGMPRGEYDYGASVERVVERHGASTTYHVGADFEVRDGIAVIYARLGRQRVARLSRTSLMTSVLEDLAPKGALDDAISVGDAWLSSRKDGASERYLQAAARRLLVEAEAGPVFLHADHLGSLTLATDAEGKVRGERAFYPSGEVRAERGFVDVYGFTGQRHDESTGLTHFMYRELDPSSGRWASTDPLFAAASVDSIGRFGESTTAYAYVGNRMLDGVDPLGLNDEKGGSAKEPAKNTNNRRESDASNCSHCKNTKTATTIAKGQTLQIVVTKKWFQRFRPYGAGRYAVDPGENGAGSLRGLTHKEIRQKLALPAKWKSAPFLILEVKVQKDFEAYHSIIKEQTIDGEYYRGNGYQVVHVSKKVNFSKLIADGTVAVTDTFEPPGQAE